MTKYEQLIDRVCESEIIYMRTESVKIPAQSLKVNDGDYGIFFNEDAYTTTAEKYVALAHAKAQCDIGAVYFEGSHLLPIMQCDYLARKRAILETLPINLLRAELKECVYDGELDEYELADRLDVPFDFLRRGLRYYLEQGVSFD